MANEEQLSILRQGVEAWNAWRKENRAVRPDLLEADLSGTDLSGADLHGATLEEATFQGADLQRANLREANLREANLGEANLREADLQRANLQWASLQRANLSPLPIAEFQKFILFTRLKDADLREANLTGANLQMTDLQGANLQGAIIHGAHLTHAIARATSFTDLDLRGVHGLDTIRHDGPSTIGIDTLYKSHGDIPESFLRGCGVPDSMIEYARSLVAAERPIDYYSCFISYSSQDEAIAQRLHADLQAQGVRCWFAPHDLEIGAPIVRGIDEAIRIYDKLLIILSEAAVTSRWVAFEVSTALHREVEQGRTMLFPIRLDDAVLSTPSGWAAQLRARNIGDFRAWKDHDAYQEAFTRLLRDLKAKDQGGT